MENKIIRTTEEFGLTKVKLADGRELECKSKTVYTHYENGRKDCTVIIEKPLGLASDNPAIGS